MLDVPGGCLAVIQDLTSCSTQLMQDMHRASAMLPYEVNFRHVLRLQWVVVLSCGATCMLQPHAWLSVLSRGWWAPRACNLCIS